MNINEAKQHIKYAITAYLSKNELGNYLMPIEKQRPVFLMGPPGIGKTAIMEQIAQELGIGLISYSMTHHTRQSALGLPFIVHKNYDGMECDVSEYTMSEIIAAVYDMMQETGIKEGILFLDEINCVSETLSPIMLQFLQYKIFGRHKVPPGWIVVTAGNPPEYNNSVHEFDIVTWDRLKRIDIEPNFDTWKEYALNSGVHPAVLTYLEIKKYNFYKVETTVGGKSFVTARGWEDLSRMIQLFEINHLPVNETLVVQYLQNKQIAKDFAAYYDLFNKYRSDYQIDQILAGNAPDEIKNRAKVARFDERLSLLGLLTDAVLAEITQTMNQEELLRLYMDALKEYKQELSLSVTDPRKELVKIITAKQKKLRDNAKAANVSAKDQEQMQRLLIFLENLQSAIDAQDGKKAFKTAKADFDKRLSELKTSSQSCSTKLANAFNFCDEVFSQGNEMLIFVTELTLSTTAAKFIGRYGSPEYFKHNKELLFYERQQEIITELDNLNLDALE